MAKMSKGEREWQAEQDARTLAEAAEIKANKARAKRAVTAAKKLAVNAQKTANAAAKQAGVRRRKK